MPTRRQYIEQIRRMIYGGQPTNDASITVNLVNQWLNQALGVAAKQNYKDNIALDGIGYINNSFYSNFTGISIASAGNFRWLISLPEIPLGVGRNEGISTMQLVDTDGRITNPFIPLSENQKTYYQNMMPIPNKVLYYYEGKSLYAISTLLLNQYTANITMVSGGLSTDLDTTLTIPPDYIPVMTEYLKAQLLFERNQPVDTQNDGLDAIRTT